MSFVLEVPFQDITVLGDCHIRSMAVDLKKEVKDRISVRGVCKLGAGLMNLAPTTEPLRDHSYVVMTGTNDAEVGYEKVITKRLQEVIEVCKRSSDLLLVPIWTRHDLPYNSPIQQTTGHVKGPSG